MLSFKKIIGISFSLLSGLVLLSGCSLLPKLNQKALDSSVSKSSSSSSAKPPVSLTNTQVVGSDQTGYMRVPENWIQFHDVDTTDEQHIVQYYDGTENNIVTLLGLNKTELAADDDNFTGERIAYNYYQTYQEQKISNIRTQRVTFKQRPLYEISGYDQNTKKNVVTYVIQPSDHSDCIYSVTFEGSLANVNQLKNYFETSWSANQSN